MTAFIINSEISLQSAIGILREEYAQYKYLSGSFKSGQDRSIDQNAISHLWYGQLARELREDDALGWKSFCKLNYGVPILRAEDDEFRQFYDGAIRMSLTYEQKLVAMKYLPVTSEMKKHQLSKYLEAMQVAFLQRGVRLEFPEQKNMKEAA